MTASENSVKKYVVRLSGAEREQLEKSFRKGRSPAQRLSKARLSDVRVGARLDVRRLRGMAGEYLDAGADDDSCRRLI
jgi:hypothetical protein